MSFSFKGRKSPPEPAPLSRQPNGRVSLSERKLSAWAMVMGVRLPSDYPESRIRRRGGLPDVDFSGASPDPGYRSPLQRLSDRIASALRSLRDWRAPATTVAGAVAEDIGESARTPYIEEVGPALGGKPDQAGEEASEYDSGESVRRAA